jgi:hypothetical protein
MVVLNLIDKGVLMENMIVEIVQGLPVDWFIDLGFLNVVIPAALAVRYVYRLATK